MKNKRNALGRGLSAILRNPKTDITENRNEEKNLRNAKYRQLIASCIYKAIVKFRYSREQYLAEN